MTLYLTFREFRALIVTAVELDKLWPYLRQFDFYMGRAAMAQGGVKLILP